MLVIDAYLDKSPIQGLGVFAKQPIAKGTVIWKFDPRFDRLIEVEVYESTTGPVKSYLDRYCIRAGPTPATSSSRRTMPAT